MVSDHAREIAEEWVDIYEGEILPRLKNNISGERCTVCNGEEYKTGVVKATCTVEEYGDVCRWGHAITARTLSIAIPSVPDVHRKSTLLEAHCEKHGGDVGFSLNDLQSESAPQSQSQFYLQAETVTRPKPIHQHHVSYEPPETMAVCSSCHSKIHHNPEFRVELEPDMSRAESGFDSTWP